MQRYYHFKGWRQGNDPCLGNPAKQTQRPRGPDANCGGCLSPTQLHLIPFPEIDQRRVSGEGADPTSLCPVPSVTHFWLGSAFWNYSNKAAASVDSDSMNHAFRKNKALGFHRHQLERRASQTCLYKVM